MEINGVPLHPLVVHAAVVFTPMAALTALAYAARERWQRVLRWPMVALGSIAALSVQAAVLTGEQLKDSMGALSPLVETHEMWAGRLQAGMWVLGGLMVLTGWLGPRLGGPWQPAGRALLAVGAVVVLFLVFRTGDAGARAVWS